MTPLSEYCPHCERAPDLPEARSYFQRFNPRTERWEFDVERARVEFANDAYTKDGVVRWKSNDRVPPVGILDLWRHLGMPFDYTKSLATEERETQEFLEQYRKRERNRRLSPEERYEMRAAFGPNVTVVNVVTGRRYRT